MSSIVPKGKAAFALHQEILGLRNALMENFLQLGAKLSIVKKEKYFKTLDFDTFAAYLATPELSLSLSSAYALIDIHEKFLTRLKIPAQRLLPIGRKKLEMISSIVDEQNADTWLSEAEHLSTSDLAKRLRSHKHQPVFEYKYSKRVTLAFEGDTWMEKMVQDRLPLAEYLCLDCGRSFWVPTAETKYRPRCPYDDDPQEPEHKTERKGTISFTNPGHGNEQQA